MKAKLLVIVPMIVLLSLSAYFTAQAHFDSAPPRPTFVRLEDQVDYSGGDVEVCEGQLDPVREGGEINWTVNCEASHITLVRASSLVGQPRRGYAAYADLASPRRMLYYSQWVYPESSEATKARLRWREESAHKAAEHEVNEWSNGFLITRKDEHGMPSWVWAAQEGHRLAVVTVEAAAPRLTPEQVEEGIAQEMNQQRTKEEATQAFFETYLENLQPEDERATKSFFADICGAIERDFLATQ
jgi:hypothetical protein